MSSLFLPPCPQSSSPPKNTVPQNHQRKAKRIFAKKHVLEMIIDCNLGASIIQASRRFRIGADPQDTVTLGGPLRGPESRDWLTCSSFCGAQLPRTPPSHQGPLQAQKWPKPPASGSEHLLSLGQQLAPGCPRRHPRPEPPHQPPFHSPQHHVSLPPSKQLAARAPAVPHREWEARLTHLGMGSN